MGKKNTILATQTSHTHITVDTAPPPSAVVSSVRRVLSPREPKEEWESDNPPIPGFTGKGTSRKRGGSHFSAECKVR